jgi:hypothetical protein
MKRKEILGLNCVELNAGQINLLVSESVGPRILSLCYKGSDNLFAELPNEYLEYPGDGNFYFYGGHRLWIAPENPAITYKPDNQPVKIKETVEFVEFCQEPDRINGFQKSFQIRSTKYENIVVIDHMIHNTGELVINCAPWAITQFRLGGVAIIPQNTDIKEDNMLLPDRSIILWPYTDINDPRISIENQFIFIRSEPSGGPLKIGVSNTRKWIAYYIDNFLFIKYAENKAPDQLVDLGAIRECYCNSKFLELETQGTFRPVLPNEIIQHREVWRIIELPIKSFSKNRIIEFFENDEMADICLNMI